MVQSKIRGDTSMKTRTLVRKHGWTPVNVDRLEINWPKTMFIALDKEDSEQFNEIKTWCDETVGKENYVAVLQDGGSNHNVKRVVFKNAQDALMFKLKWLTF